VTLEGTLGEEHLTVHVHDLTTDRELGQATVTGTTFALPITFAAPGSHQLRITAQDAAGHQSASLLDTFIDLTSPVVRELETVPASAVSGVEFIDVVLSEQIDLSTLDENDVILTRDGGANLISDAVAITHHSGNTYRIGPLDTLTSEPGNYQFHLDMEEILDRAGNAGTGSATLDLDLQLKVLSLTPTPSGFVAQLSHDIERSALNLYDVASGAYGPSDVTLVGDTVGPVTGSLVLDGRELIFVATGGPLPADTYTATLRGAAEAIFHGDSGKLLDGDRDGTPGGDYVTRFTQAGPQAVVLSLPDFSRGPGQAVHVPAMESGLPLTISDGSGVQSITLTLLYDPALLNVTGASIGADVPADASVNLNVSEPGQALLIFSAPTPLSGGAVQFVTLTADVPGTAAYNAAHVLALREIRVNDQSLAASGDDALHAVTYFGDTTGNGDYSGLDAVQIARVVVGLDGGYEAHLRIDPVILADITSNGDLSGLDAVRVAQAVVGLNPAEIPLLPDGQAPAGVRPAMLANEASASLDAATSAADPKSPAVGMFSVATRFFLADVADHDVHPISRVVPPAQPGNRQTRESSPHEVTTPQSVDEVFRRTDGASWVSAADKEPLPPLWDELLPEIEDALLDMLTD
jgi:hypothetical protein